MKVTIWHMRIECWTTKSTNTHLEYVILITFPLQRWLHYPHCLSPSQLLSATLQTPEDCYTGASYIYGCKCTFLLMICNHIGDRCVYVFILNVGLKLNLSRTGANNVDNLNSRMTYEVLGKGEVQLEGIQQSL